RGPGGAGRGDDAAALLGRHVEEGPDRLAGGGGAEVGDAEVAEDDLAGGPAVEEVGGLDVPVDDAAPVRGGEGGEERRVDLERVEEGQGTALPAPLQPSPGGQLPGDAAVVLVGVADR